MPMFSVLGPLRAWNGDAEVVLGPPQQQALLALLLVRAGEPVTFGEAVDVLWPNGPPASAVAVLHRYASQLRRIVGAEALVRAGRAYRLDVPPGALDLHEFRRMLGEAAAYEQTDPDRAAARIADGLELWRGHQVATIDPAVRAMPVFAAVGHEFVAASVRGAELAATRETAQRLIPYLRAVTSAVPLHEPAHAALMRLLALSGRPADALVEFAGLRKRLAAELGVGPGPEARDMHRQVLAMPGAPAVGPAVESYRPWQVAADLGVFTGRAEEIARLAGFLRGGPGTARVAVVSGMAGVGKTTLAVHLAHGLADEFPDGTLFADLRGFDPSRRATSADEVLRRFLGELGVAQSAQPAGFDARVALYRSLLAVRRMLIVVDNVRDSAQALPLLPGSRGSAAIVTSRDRLAGLVVGAGAMPVALAPMTDPDARLYLAQRLGCERVAGEPDAVRRILAACGGLPMALAVCTARAAANPNFQLSEVAEELSTRGDPPQVVVFPGPHPYVSLQEKQGW